ncbi:hypothetical protein GCM10010394_63210 [Streptomyces crystallinus]|uniref:Uncharacterized protein n=1 Tax=Streptomyces crystallinus TaxID=68191 RepID=A0ABN1GYN9_9ACTN
MLSNAQRLHPGAGAEPQVAFAAGQNIFGKGSRSRTGGGGSVLFETLPVPGVPVWEEGQAAA